MPKDFLQGAQDRYDVIVIVSAMSGKTNELVGWVNETSPLYDAREYDAVVSSGENVTAGLMALTLQEMDIPARSWQGWQVPIRSVDEFGNIYPRTIHLEHQALSTSGDTEQFVEINGRHYSHIIDPRTGIGLTNRIAVTVVASSSTVADSRATAISVLGIKKGMDYANSKKLQVLILTMSNKKHRLIKSPQWKLW